MRDVRRQITQGRKIITKHPKIDLQATELMQLVEEYEIKARETGMNNALYNLIVESFYMGVSGGYKCAKTETKESIIRNVKNQEVTEHFRTVRKWKDLRVIETKLPGGCQGVVAPWGKDGNFRIFIDEDLNERQKTETFVHEMLHLYRGDFDKIGANVSRIEAECHDLTREMMKIVEHTIK